ncbi:hypothetical protein G7B40_025275 [Aetokthonos hydrillicola Thurmond2011]|jgi:hypothetical protein|uniref:Type IV secretion system coupling protein TraD DNA-binding domain-containing protein n=1 Tax=Aetokthonos hydrillicola Thurmond2011 TaxID=2712845 RepID=A0AAP5IAC2_9CYAN|nr:hypothetical protein [Aetokthonos hydrillicola]MBO3458430.1 hypothetical protein [Aetokthonos hydrillicola CCALA 1050]MBW4586243.1 hypothetical protein [Aetokthonos hydrillicola CCALA 1050]MDR9897850.1 hypothetical protein [Aetokthonos hydrillicola Thurmond2011]
MSSSTKSKSPKDKVGTKSISTKEIAVVKHLTPFEDLTHIAAIASISIGGRKDIGAIILKKNDGLQIKFCFDCQGIHPSVPEEQIVPIFEGIEAGLKEIPNGETLTLHLGSFTEDSDRQQELKAIENGCSRDELTLLIRSERLRIRELTKNGTRKNKFLRIYCTYTVSGSEDGKTADPVEKFILHLKDSWDKFTGQIHQVRYQRVESILKNSFFCGFQLWEQTLANKMGLNFRALGANELWTVLWKHFNTSTPPIIPHLLILDENGVREEQNSDYHIRHLILETQESVPFLDRAWVYLQNHYIGALTFTEKPVGWVDEYAQLRYLWELIARDKVSDTEIICQLSKANEALAKTALQRITKQSIVSSAMSAQKNSVDVKANLNIEEAIAAQETIYKGAVPIHTAVIFLVHRREREKLDEACRYISSCFLRPAVVVREMEYAWKIWLQSLPIVWENLLTKPFNRRLPYFSGEVPGLMPIIKTATGDKSGFELIAEEGGTPVHLDLYNNHKNLAVFGTTRSGKSVLVAGLLTLALAQNIPVVALDYPKPDGSSTFTDYTNFLGDDGAYFDISKEANNLFELPDLRGLNVELRKERMTDFKEFLKSTLITMVLGTNPFDIDSTRVSNIESILTLAIETFFADDDIKLRYKEALEKGLGTPEWNDTPTLNDFYNYCSPGYIKLDTITNNSEDILKALDQIRLRLRFWLNSRVGKSISRPSSFRTDAPLLVFALRSLATDSDAAILALSAYAAALRRALSSKASIFFLDEAPILFQFESIAELIGRLCANGAKAGIRVILSAQEPDSIYQSKSAPKIFANLTTRLIGRIQTSAVDPFIRHFKYPYEIISRNSTEAFFPKKENIYSQWLLDDNGKFTFCRYYPAYCLLAAVANNPQEQELRTTFLTKYKDDPLTGMVRFAEEYVKMIRKEELTGKAHKLLNKAQCKLS